jgi:hypothetical protein
LIRWANVILLSTAATPKTIAATDAAGFNFLLLNCRLARGPSFPVRRSPGHENAKINLVKSPSVASNQLQQSGCRNATTKPRLTSGDSPSRRQA